MTEQPDIKSKKSMAKFYSRVQDSEDKKPKVMRCLWDQHLQQEVEKNNGKTGDLQYMNLQKTEGINLEGTVEGIDLTIAANKRWGFTHSNHQGVQVANSKKVWRD